MKSRILSVSLLFSLLFFSSCAELNQVADALGAQALSTTDISKGLKQALEIGISTGSNQLSELDGYLKSPYKILLPAEAREVTDKLRFIPGWSAVEGEITTRLNRAAEDAAKSAAPIFIDAIRGMSFSDAKNILLGPKDGATRYLHQRTYDALYDSFHPIVLNSLNKFNAVDYWSDAIHAYNKIPLVKKANPELDDYVVEKALYGLFDMVEKKELSIRSDVSERTTDLLRRVFAEQDK